jgi:hypothetical protein
MAPPVGSALTRSSSTPGPSAPIGGQKQSLYHSILSLPPAKHARTIHNPADPPLEAPSRPSSHRKGSDLKKQIHAANSNKGKGKAPLPSPSGEDDMKAAATLTSLLMQARPSVGAPASPRSNAGSDTGSAHSFGQFTQSSTRTVMGGTNTQTTAESSMASVSLKPPTSTTPPPRSGTSTATGTPRPAPTDNEAADLMLFLATSPSPVRGGSQRDREAKDFAAFRALGGGNSNLRAKGRILFPNASESAILDEPKTNQPSTVFAKRAGHRLEMAHILPTLQPSTPSTRGPSGLSTSLETNVIPPTPVEAPSSGMQSGLLPPASPSRPSSTAFMAPGTPSNLPFNLNEFINVSPSPAGRRQLYDEEATRNELGAGISF